MASGDETAFAEIYDGTSRIVFGIVLRVLRDYALAQEVSQEVYLQVWRQANAYDCTKGMTSAWINTIAHRKAVDRVRHEQRSRYRDHEHNRMAIDVVDGDPATLVLTDLEARRNAQEIHGALARLPDAQRVAIALAYFDGFTQQQIADYLTVPLGTVKTRTRAGLLRLQTLLSARSVV